MSVMQCDNGHNLTHVSENDRIVECNICDREVELGAAVYRCVPCDYDVCGECFEKPAPKVVNTKVVEAEITYDRIRALMACNEAQRRTELSGKAWKVGNLKQIATMLGLDSSGLKSVVFERIVTCTGLSALETGEDRIRSPRYGKSAAQLRGAVSRSSEVSSVVGHMLAGSKRPRCHPPK